MNKIKSYENTFHFLSLPWMTLYSITILANFFNRDNLTFYSLNVHQAIETWY